MKGLLDDVGFDTIGSAKLAKKRRIPPRVAAQVCCGLMLAGVVGALYWPFRSAPQADVKVAFSAEEQAEADRQRVIIDRKIKDGSMTVGNP